MYAPQPHRRTEVRTQTLKSVQLAVGIMKRAKGSALSPLLPSSCGFQGTSRSHDTSVALTAFIKGSGSPVAHKGASGVADVVRS